jgi:Zn-finger nucleic acid-binding protein
MKCPTCATENLVMSERQGIEIDYCPVCRGVWLDRGELDKIIEKVLSSEKANQQAVPPPAGFGQVQQPPPSSFGHVPHTPPPPPPPSSFGHTHHDHHKHHYDHGYHKHHKKHKKDHWLDDLFD